MNLKKVRQMYLTDEHYAIAAENGICQNTLYYRFHVCGWSINNAITTPVRKTSEHWIKWKETCQANGISNSTFNQRLYKGMTPEQAATTPLADKPYRRKNQ